MEDSIKWMKKIFGGIFVFTVVVVAIIGLLCGKVIEGTLIAEIGKWAFMAVLLGGLMVGLAYVPVNLLRHKRNDLYPEYGKKWFWALFKKNK